MGRNYASDIHQPGGVVILQRASMGSLSQKGGGSVNEYCSPKRGGVAT